MPNPTTSVLLLVATIAVAASETLGAAEKTEHFSGSDIGVFARFARVGLPGTE